MKNKKFQGLVGLALIASLVNPLPWFENVNLLDSVKVLAAEEEPPADEDVPDAAETSIIQEAKAKYDEAFEIFSDPEYSDADKDMVLELLNEIAMSALQKINKTASRDIITKIEALRAQINGTAPTPTPAETTEEIVVREDIEPKETRIPNADMLEGKESRKEGTPGKALVIYKIYKIDGKEVRREKISTKVEVEPKDTVIEYGTKKVPVISISEVKVEEPIQYTIREVNNPNLEKGQRKVVTSGKNGVKTVTYTVRTVDGVETERTKVSETITISAVEEVIEVGTKEVKTISWTPIVAPVVKEETKIEEIPFTKETRKNADLSEGETRVVQEGKNGTRTIVYKVTTVDGKEVNRMVSSDTTVPAVVEITEISTKVASTYEETTETKTEVVAYTSRTVENAELPKGETRILQEGKDGVRTITYKVGKQNGVEVSREEVSNEVTTPAIEEVIEIGTKEVKAMPWTPIVIPVVTEETKSEDVPFVKETRENTELPKDETRVIQEGKNGTRTIVYKVVTVDGKEVGRTIASDTTVSGVTEIIEVGTKEVTTVDGVETKRMVKSETKTEAVTKIVEVGTKEKQTTTPKAAPVKENKNTLPKTGESRSVFAIVGAIVLVAVAGLIGFRKRER
ncbi:G5 domain-containing protein [Streptococcus ruminantium]|uniref:G5 domain-containing protein n=1 Tax=Streptococcus ruminantium TaxID=1917441 RepID=UPI001F3EE95C|nr:G5 domain-containing protein [Streptococcus ruminantium]BDD41814.1 hypothetical protein GUT189_01470 [Streptococcus ruminantium]